MQVPATIARDVTLTTEPLTPDRWTDLETLFGKRGASSGCWCMFWHQTGTEFERDKYEPNKQAFQHQVETAVRPPGVLAYRDREPVGWCAVAPRMEYERLGRSRKLKPVDSEPVWSVVCFYVARAARRSGVTTALLAGAEAFAQSHGANWLEAYPVDPEPGPWADSSAFTGRSVVYERAGFIAIERPGQRKVMRKRLG